MINPQFFSKRWVSGFVFLIVVLTFLTTEVMVAHSFVVRFDVWFDNVLFNIRTPLLLQVFSGITYLGNALIVIAIAGLVTLWLLFYKRDLSYVLGLATTIIGATGSAYVLKAIIARPRPTDLVPSVIETSFSFPSGHATAAMALYGFSAYMLCKLYPEKTKLVLVLMVILILLTGFSRLYLGVHFPSDVLAGYILGGIWLLVGIQVTTFFSSKRIHWLSRKENSIDAVERNSF